MSAMQKIAPPRYKLYEPSKCRASYESHRALLESRGRRAELAFLRTGDALQREAHITEDLATKAVWHHAARIRLRIGQRLQKLGGTPRPLHANRGTTRVMCRIERVASAKQRCDEKICANMDAPAFSFWRRAAELQYKQARRLAQGLAQRISEMLG